MSNNSHGDGVPRLMTIEDILVVARELPPEEQGVYLDNACADAEQRERLRIMLDEAAAADAQAAEAIRAFSPTAPVVEGPGMMIGRYKLLQRLGEGGFGVVFMAEQREPITRRVALKVVKQGMDTRQVIARFEAERQALAMMDHPAIAKVFDAGATATGRPYFVMELVRGLPITRFCDEQGYDLRQRLELFSEVCAAVQHAHQKGIIHRDLKPSNILVGLDGDRPVPKVIDFGIAKATQQQLTEMTLFTRFEQFLGTPLYVSPEQVGMNAVDIDTRSDIYSLGVILYELITGSLPLDAQEVMASGFDEMRRIIREKEPPKPSTRLGTLEVDHLKTVAKNRRVEPAKLGILLRGDLDWIVLKAIEKDRARRYPTANALAADIRRFLDDEPVTATPPSRLYSWGKFIRRHRSAAYAVAAVMLSLVGGIIASSILAVRATRAERTAAASLDELRTTAPAFADQARGLADRELFDEALEKLDYAIRLRPDDGTYRLAKADILQATLRLEPAAAVYREAAALPGASPRAAANAGLCDALRAEEKAQGRLTRESLARLLSHMAHEKRPAAHMLPVGRLLGEEKKLLLAAWTARLAELPIPPKRPLGERLAMADNGRLVLDLSGTGITELSPLKGMPLSSLNLRSCEGVSNLEPLRGLPIEHLVLDGTRASDLSPLASLGSLQALSLANVPVADITPLRGLPLRNLDIRGTGITSIEALRGGELESLVLRQTRVADLGPLQTHRKLRDLDCTAIPTTDFSPLAGLPLEELNLQNTLIADLSVLRGMPLRLLLLNGCLKAKGYAVLSTLDHLEDLLLPESIFGLGPEELRPIAALKDHPRLRKVQAGLQMDGLQISAATPASAFWKAAGKAIDLVLLFHERGWKDCRVGWIGDGLVSVNLEGNALHDLALLDGIPVASLRLRGIPVADLSPLAGLPLTSLDLIDMKLPDLTPLARLRLEHLKIDDAPSTDLSFLAQHPLCETLTSLFVERTKVADFHPISACHNLKSLSLVQTGFSDLALLRGHALEELFLGGTKITDLEPIAGTKLRRLWIDNTPVKDLSPLLRCTTLEQIIVPRGAENIPLLRKSRSLQFVSFHWDSQSKRPSMTADQFWADLPRNEARELAEGGRMKEAEAMLEKSAAELRAEAGEFPSAIIAVLRDLGAIRIWDGRPAEALEPLTEAMRMGRERQAPEPDTSELIERYIHVLSLALAGEPEQVKTACAEALARVRHGTPNPNHVQRVLICVCVPTDAGVPEAAIREGIEAALPMAAGPVGYWYQVAAGLAHYRLGEDGKALACLEKVGIFENSSSSCLSDLTRALIALRAGERTKAEFHRKRAAEVLSRRWPPTGEGAFDERYWPNWLAAHVLSREVDAALAH